MKRTSREKEGLRATNEKSTMKMPKDTNGRLRSWMTGNRGRNGMARRGKESNR